MQHKILIRFFLVVTFGLVYLSTMSNKNGIFNGGTNCGTCHGSANAATTVTLTGLPSTFETGKTYPLTFSITNTTNLKAGFNILVSAGILAAGTGSRINTLKNQITHSSPASATASTTSFNFNWTAPSNINTVTFNAVGNAVNGNNQDDAGDKWATITTTLAGKFPSGINTDLSENIRCFPNPANDMMLVEGLSAQEKTISIMNLKGQIIMNENSVSGITYELNTSKLDGGIYLLLIRDEYRAYSIRFIKN